ncbi:MAG: AtpZ/AtpI family protein [Planctomycetota bacterium]|jgi:hypothetical protein
MANDGQRKPNWVRFSGIGIEFAGAVAGFTLVGYLFDRHYESGPKGVLIGAILGLVGGTYNLIKESMKAVRDVDAMSKVQDRPETDKQIDASGPQKGAEPATPTADDEFPGGGAGSQ